ncbi:MAG: hypothetical protein DHS20C21_18990 [Gemmatimonadota bacterium]|nr:MAG: hypothetical protein DHS20C21_18990 [Gemmatimonadota bacterium]
MAALGRSRPNRVLWGCVAIGLGIPVAGHAVYTDITVLNTSFSAKGITFGTGWGDFDNDGDQDCFVSRHWVRPIIFENSGDGNLEYAVFPPLFDPPDDHHGGLIADIDQDGDLDLYLTGGADAGAGEVPKKMYRNDGGFVFTDVAAAWGLEDTFARGRAASAIDLELDGDVDIFVAKAARTASPNALFINDGNQSFTDQALAAGVADEFGSVGGIWGDYDNDGDPDLFISGEEEVSFETRLYRNDGNLSFSNVTASVLPSSTQRSAAAWGDYDNDGDLDLATGLGDRALFDAVSWTPDSISFFFNTRLGDDGLDGLAFTQTGDSASYDLALDGFFQQNSIFISETAYGPPPFSPFPLPFEIFGAPTFSPGTSLAFYLWTQEFFDVWEMRCNAPPAAGHSFAGVITANGQFTDVSGISTETYALAPRGTQLWRNDGGVFTDVTVAAGIVDTVNVHSMAWVDVDQDGRLDLYVMNKGDTENLNEPNVFYRNLGGGVFTDATAAWQLEGPAGGMGDTFAFQDYEGDGDLDVVMTSGVGPKFFADQERVRFYRNDGVTGNRLRVDLEGTTSTKDGYGAWVTCVSAIAGRQHHYVTGNNWRGGQTMLEPYFGLGADTVVDSLIVAWPSGVLDIVTAIPSGDVTVIESQPVVAAPTVAAAVAPLGVAGVPQPSSAAVRFSLSGRRDLPARLQVFDVAGRQVHSQSVPAGASRADWDGRNALGERVGGGVYFVRLVEGDRTATNKLVRLRP